jgi:hypothetical protein
VPGEGKGGGGRDTSRGCTAVCFLLSAAGQGLRAVFYKSKESGRAFAVLRETSGIGLLRRRFSVFFSHHDSHARDSRFPKLGGRVYRLLLDRVRLLGHPTTGLPSLAGFSLLTYAGWSEILRWVGNIGSVLSVLHAKLFASGLQQACTEFLTGRPSSRPRRCWMGRVHSTSLVRTWTLVTIQFVYCRLHNLDAHGPAVQDRSCRCIAR